MRSLTLLCALAALLLSGLAVFLSWSRPPPGESMAAPIAGSNKESHNASSERVATLEQRLETVEAELARLHLSFSQGEQRVVDGPPDEDLLQRLAQVETALAQNRVRDQEAGQAQPAPRVPLTLEETIAVVRNPTLDLKQRLKAISDLRGKSLEDGTDARLGVLDEMIRIGLEAEDGKHRAHVWRQMSGVSDLRLRQPLLDALANDKAEEVREEAAETLADFLPDAGVEAALRWSANNDASERVRKQAGASLMD